MVVHKNKSVDTHRFAMVPRSDVPRSQFRLEHSHKTTFDAGYLIPVYCEEVLPGDTFNLKMTCFARLATPLFPIMDNVYIDSFFFFVPIRLLWPNFQRFMGEQDSPGDSIDFVTPWMNAPAGGWPVGSIGDYFGFPTAGQISPGTLVGHSALPMRAYNAIYNAWFRDQNLVDEASKDWGDGPDSDQWYALRRRGKRHDYFTSCLPWPQKGEAVSIGLGVQANVRSKTDGWVGGGAVTGSPTWWSRDNTAASSLATQANATATWSNSGQFVAPQIDLQWQDPQLYADLTTATAVTINALRESFAIQRLQERDARGGTRYSELVRSHFGVVSPDARLQRPEYLGGGSSPIVINPIAQTSATDSGGSTSPLGTLGAMGTSVLNQHGFSQAFTEHGIVIGLVNVRADLTYQQGLRRQWSRRTRYDFYWPAFAHLGEQAVLQKELFISGNDAEDNKVFGYQERWAEYRYHPSMITGQFRSTHSTPLDGWHLAQEFASAPVLNQAFIEENPPLERVLAVGAAANGHQVIADFFFSNNAARPLPAYSVPGLIDHF